MNCEVGSKKGWMRGWRATDPLAAAGFEARKHAAWGSHFQIPAQIGIGPELSGESYVITQPFNQFFLTFAFCFFFFSPG